MANGVPVKFGRVIRKSTMKPVSISKFEIVKAKMADDRDFWAIVCKTVRPMLSDRCLSCLFVTFVHCGQTVGRNKMKLGTQVRLGPGHIVLDGDPAPLPMFIVAKRLNG